jgi:hypothetical protein
MKKIVFLFALLLAVVATPAYAQSQKATAKAADTPVPTVAKPVPPDLAEKLSIAAATTVQRRKELEDSAIYQAWLAAKNSEQATLLYIAAKLGADPDQCKPIYGKDGSIEKIECPVPASAPAAPAPTSGDGKQGSPTKKP